MRYLFDEQKNIRDINNCKGNRFVVHFNDGKMSIMDNLGRIFDGTYSFSDLEQREDGLFLKRENYKDIALLDENENVILENFNYVDDESHDGIIFYLDSENKGKYIRHDGSPFLSGMDKIAAFSSGIGAARLPSGNIALFSKKEFDDKEKYIDIRDEYPQGHYFDPEVFDYNFIKIDDFDFIFPFYNPDFSIVYKDKAYFVIDKNGNITHKLNGYLFNYSGGDAITEAVSHVDENGNKKNIYRMFNMRLNRYITEPTNTFLCVNYDGYIRLPDKSRKIMRQDGSIVTTSEFSSQGQCCDGMFPIYYYDVGDDWKYTYLNAETGVMFKNLYDYASEFSENLGVVEIEKKRYYIDKNENLYGAGYRTARRFSEGMAVAGGLSKVTYINRKFEKLKEKFNSASDFSCGFGVVETDNVFDVITKSGVHLSKISKYASQIESDPEKFVDILINDGKLCEKSLKDLFEFALCVATSNADMLAQGSAEYRQIEKLCQKLTDEYLAYGKKHKIFG